MGRPTERDEPSVVIELIPDKPNATIELETADLKELAQHGTLAIQRQNATRALALEDIEEIRPGGRSDLDAKVIIEPQEKPNATVALGLHDIEEVKLAKPTARERPIARRAKGDPAYPTVIVELDAAAPKPIEEPKLEKTSDSGSLAKPGTPIHVRRVTPERPRVHVDGATRKPNRSRMWLVVMLYIACAAALGVSVYYRFIA